jgi:hypothetical protein
MANDSKAGGSVAVTGWKACYNSGDEMIVLSCRVTTKDASPSIVGVGLILNDNAGKVLASTYAELSNGCESVSPSINLLPGTLEVGATVMGVVTGEAEGAHFFFEQELVIENC